MCKYPCVVQLENKKITTIITHSLYGDCWHSNRIQGVCKYVLVKTADFELHAGNEQRRANSAVTWVKEVMLEYQGQ